MIDTHCHLLPGIDDGAQSDDDTLAMARMAVADGIEQIIVTPHQLADRFENPHSKLLEVYQHTMEVLRENAIPLNVHLGAEVHYSSLFWEKERAGEITTMAGTRYILVEFAPRILPRVVEEAIEKLVTRGYMPIIAHPERIPTFDLSSPLVENLKQIGAYYQITAHSIDGTFGGKMQRYAKKWVLTNNCHLIGTDAHNVNRRKPQLSAARKMIDKWCKNPVDASNTIFENSNRVLQGSKLIGTQIESKSWYWFK